MASLVSRGDAHKWHRHRHTGTSTKHTDTREQSVVFCQGFFSSLAQTGDAGGKAGRPSTAPRLLPLPRRKALGATACTSAVKTVQALPWGVTRIRNLGKARHGCCGTLRVLHCTAPLLLRFLAPNDLQKLLRAPHVCMRGKALKPSCIP